MMRQFLLAVIMIPSLAFAQEIKFWEVNSLGIQFEKSENWQQILKKAKEQNKFIFIDCYATWCVPCKKMSREVFVKKEVGDFMNSRFVSLQVQMDSTKSDNEFTRNWYNDAHNLKEKYGVTAFPTYLFFSPDGEIVHRYLNALPDSLFLKVAANALNPEKQYYTLLKSYRENKKDYTKVMYLANISKQIGEERLANSLAKDFIENYLNGLSEKDLYNKKYLEFVSSFSSVLSPKDKIFNLVYKNGEEADKIFGQQGFSKNLVCGIIRRDEIDPRLNPYDKAMTVDPDWDQLTRTIGKKFNKYYTNLVVVEAQINWYSIRKNKGQQIKYIVKKTENYGIDTAGIGWVIFNNIAFELFFKHCDNKDTLTKMIHWMEVVNQNHPDDQANTDTYANLLYKVGRKKEAIEWEEKALRFELEAAKKEKRNPDPGFKETLDKMKSGMPTWVVK